MTLTSEPSVSGANYRDVLIRAGLHEAFEEAWDVPLEEHDRLEAGLGSVDEHILIEETVEVDDGLWTFTMNVNQYHPENEVVYHLTPVETYGEDIICVPSSLIEELEDTVETIFDNRPEDPELVSYALDDLRNQVREMRENK